MAKLEDFKLNSKYIVKKVDFEDPFTSDILEGDTIVITVLEPVSSKNVRGDTTLYEIENWQQFLRVDRGSLGVRLLHPDTIEYFEEVL